MQGSIFVRSFYARRLATVVACLFICIRTLCASAQMGPTIAVKQTLGAPVEMLPARIHLQVSPQTLLEIAYTARNVSRKRIVACGIRVSVFGDRHRLLSSMIYSATYTGNPGAILYETPEDATEPGVERPSGTTVFLSAFTLKVRDVVVSIASATFLDGTRWSHDSVNVNPSHA